MGARYQVIAECAYVKTSDAAGVSWRLFHKGAVIEGDTPNLQHLLDNGYVVKVGDDVTGGVDADGVPEGARGVEVPSGLTTTPTAAPETRQTADERAKAERDAAERAEADEKAKADAEVETRRAAAREKLAALDGAAPDGRASKDVLVEYLVVQGGSYEDLSKADPADLKKMVKDRQS